MLGYLHKLFARVAPHVTVWQALAGGGIVSVGGIGAWIGATTDWIASYGPIGWYFAALIGALLAALILLAFGYLRHAWVKAGAVRKWSEIVDEVNPLDPEFHKRRLKIADLAHPMSGRIVKKRFSDCELLGPANILFYRHTTTMGTTFKDCDFVAIKPDANMKLVNVIALENTEILGGSIWKCTIFVAPELIADFVKVGADFISPTEYPNVDNQSPPSTVA